MCYACVAFHIMRSSDGKRETRVQSVREDRCESALEVRHLRPGRENSEGRDPSEDLNGEQSPTTVAVASLSL